MVQELRRALALYEKSQGPDHPDVATTLNNLAQLLQATNRLPEAESLTRRALAIKEKSLGPDHPDVAACLNNLALLLRVTNRPAEAEPLMRRALAIDEKSLGPVHPDVSRDLNHLGGLLLESLSRPAEVEPLMRRALLTLLHLSRTTGYKEPNQEAYLQSYGAILHAMGKSRSEIDQAIRGIIREAIATEAPPSGPRLSGSHP